MEVSKGDECRNLNYTYNLIIFVGDLYISTAHNKGTKL